MTYRTGNLILLTTLLCCFSCFKDDSKRQTTEYDDIFGEWKVTRAEFIRGLIFLFSQNLDDKSLENSSENYVYRFRRDSTFERGKPNYQHGNVEEAHGRFSISQDEKIMKWFVKYDKEEGIDTTELQITAITPLKIVINESLGGGHQMLQILERVEDEPK